MAPLLPLVRILCLFLDFGCSKLVLAYLDESGFCDRTANYSALQLSLELGGKRVAHMPRKVGALSGMMNVCWVL